MIEKYEDKISWHNLSMNRYNIHNKDTIQYYKKRKTQTIEQTKVFKEELIAITWHPDRFMEWCVDVEELKETIEMFGK